MNWEWKRLKLGGQVEGIHVAKMNREEWLTCRRAQHGLGGSEIGVVLDLDNYISAKRLFYDKIGLWPLKREDNRYAQRGRFFEDQIAKIWEYHDGEDRESTVRNEALGYKPRKCQNLFFMVRNKKYPGVFANVDKHLLRSPVHKGRGILEIKSMSSRVGEKYEAGYPPKFLCQLQNYLMISEYPYGELAIWLTDQDYLKVVPVYSDKEFQDYVYEACTLFMQTVEECKRELQGLRRQDEINQCAFEHEAKIEWIPTPDLAKFHSQTYKALQDRASLDVDASIDYELIDLAYEYDNAQNALKVAENAKTEALVKIQEWMRHRFAWEAKWPGGYVKWKNRISIKVEKS